MVKLKIVKLSDIEHFEVETITNHLRYAKDVANKVPNLNEKIKIEVKSNKITDIIEEVIKALEKQTKGD